MQKRYPHFMTLATGGKFPARLLSVDVMSLADFALPANGRSYQTIDSWCVGETVAKDGGYQSTDCVIGETVEGFWNLLRKKLELPGAVWIVSHNCSRVWGLCELWDRIENREIRVIDVDPLNTQQSVHESDRKQTGYLVVQDPPNIIRFRTLAGRAWCQWIDIRNYGLDPPTGYSHGGPICTWISSTMTRLIYNLKRYKLGSLRATAGSQAMHGFRHGYLKHGIYCSSGKANLKLEGESYYGGRCEAYQLGVIPEPVWGVDFRSMYPSICAEHKLPVRLIEYKDNPTREYAEYHTLAERAIAEVTVETTEPDYPYRRDFDTIFPTGQFRTVLAGPELLDAWRLDRIVKFHRMAIYDMQPALREYALALYRLRCTSEQGNDSDMASFAKTLLVSLPGKFGQIDRFWEAASHVWSDVQNGEWYGSDADGRPCRYRSIAGIVQRDVKGGFAPDANPAIAAWITSAGRVKLLDAIRTVGRKNVLYVDTDSLFLTRKGYHLIQPCCDLDSPALGKLRTVHREEKCEITGIKWYTIGNTVRNAGLPKGCVCKENGTSGYYLYDPPGTQVARGKRPEPVISYHCYRKSADYNHGNVDATGKVTPFVIKEP